MAKKNASKPVKPKKAAAKPAVATATATKSKPQLDQAFFSEGKLIARFSDGKEIILLRSQVHELHEHFGDTVQAKGNNAIFSIESHFLRIPGSKLLELAAPAKQLDEYAADIQRFDALFRIYDNFPEWLTDQLKQRDNMKQDTLAKLVNVHFTEISKYCLGKTKPRIPRFFQILLALGIDPRKL